MQCAGETGGCPVWAAVRSASRSAGPARVRQLSWVATELHRAQELGEQPEAGPGGCAEWLVGDRARFYLVAASQGRLRTRGRPGRPSTPASVRVRASVLRELAAYAGAEGTAAGIGQAPDRQWTPGDARRAFLTWLRADASELGSRTYACAALASAGVRVGEMVGLTDASMSSDGTLADLVRNPPGPGAPFLAPVTLPAYAREAVTAWLRVRDGVVVSPRVRALFVTLRPANRRGSVYARGLPVTARSLNRSHLLAVENWLALGRSAGAGLSASDLSLGRLAYHPETAGA
ncbi:hypothetical protein [Nocardioides pantholopis]|uniref:hypothetical protein n=1 Tax=Nocardioides pantholopis TaxID=2483798 RepID=UPI000FD84B00|nr:hypothetical protein [Nocardioides pantholopis]